MKEKKVTIIIPTYNRAQSITKAIKSVLNQTYQNIEVLVVDDGSTDNTEDIVKKIIKQDNRLKYISQINQGAPTARNTGIKYAQGDYIAFNDSDDTWEPQKLIKQVDILNKDLADVVFCKLKFTDAKNKINLIPKNQEEGIIINNLMGIGTQTLIGKRKVFREFSFDPIMPRFQDLELLLRITKKYRLYCLNEGLVNYTVNSDSISNNVSHLLKANKLILTKFPTLLKDWPMVAKGIQNVTFAAGKHSINIGDFETAKKCFQESILFEPNLYKKLLKKSRNYGLIIGAPLIKKFYLDRR